jgi:uncharacterized protein (TIGR02145 family)
MVTSIPEFSRAVLRRSAVGLLFLFGCGSNGADDGSTSRSSPLGSATDIDGNVYATVVIGTQEWTTENLRTTKYADGTEIPFVPAPSDPKAWVASASAKTPAYCYNKGVESADDIKRYGAIYNWYVFEPANPHSVAPAGWRVPSDRDWTILEQYLIAHGYNYDGSTSGNKIAKALAAKSGWYTSSKVGTPGNDQEANNSSGFSAVAAGDCASFCALSDCSDGVCGLGSLTHFASTTENGEPEYAGYWISRTVSSSSYEFARGAFAPKGDGVSVRLVRDLGA